MRPILLTTDAVGGVWTYSLDLARGLSARGVHVVLAVMGPAAGASQRQDADIEGVRLVETGLPLDWTAADPADLDHASERLAALAALSGVGSAHLHAPALVGHARWSVPTVAVAHSDVGTWWRAMRAGPCPADFAWRVAATQAGLHRATRVIAPTAAHAAAVQAVYGELTISVVHNGAAPRPGVSEGHGAPILTAGRLWDEGKGLNAVDQAAATGLEIAAAGPVRGPNGASIELPHLRLLGTLDAGGMARAYAGARVFVSMARYEPFGLAVLEAAQAGLRLVLSDIPGFRELWHGAATFADPADLASVLRRALDEPGDGGAQERAGRYTRDRMVEGTLAVHAGLGGIG